MTAEVQEIIKNDASLKYKTLEEINKEIDSLERRGVSATKIRQIRMDYVKIIPELENEENEENGENGEEDPLIEGYRFVKALDDYYQNKASVAYKNLIIPFYSPCLQRMAEITIFAILVQTKAAEPLSKLWTRPIDEMPEGLFKCRLAYDRAIARYGADSTVLLQYEDHLKKRYPNMSKAIRDELIFSSKKQDYSTIQTVVQYILDKLPEKPMQPLSKYLATDRDTRDCLEEVLQSDFKDQENTNSLIRTDSSSSNLGLFSSMTRGPEVRSTKKRSGEFLESEPKRPAAVPGEAGTRCK